MEKRVKCLVPATTANLGPGFDAFGIAWELYNSVEAHLLTEPGFLIENKNQDFPDLADPKRNLVTRAAEKVLERIGQKGQGIHFTLDNQIPVSRGLGSSAAGIVGGLLATNALLGNPLSERQLTELAVDLEGHPDNVCPALEGAFIASCRRPGEQTKWLRVVPPEQLRGVVAIPEFQLATKVAREAMPAKVDMADAVFNLQSAALLLGGLLQGDLELFAQAMEDRLHQPYRFPLIPGAEAVLDAAQEAGALCGALSGAGPTLVAFTDTENGESIAQVMVETWRRYEIHSRAMVLKPSLSGAKIL